MLRLAYSNRCRKLASSSSTAFAAVSGMGTKYYLPKPTTPSFLLIPPLPSRFSSNKPFSRAGKRFFPVLCAKPISREHSRSLYINGHSAVSVPPSADIADGWKGDVLRQRLADCGIEMDIIAAGQHNGLYCPRCQGGDSREKSFSIVINPDGGGATWICHRGKCGWTGGTKLEHVTNSTSRIPVQQIPNKQKSEITEESLELKPLCNEPIGYFKERGISRETLLRNRVMQRAYENQIVIAFTYWKNGNLVSCKYRDINSKKYWQEKDTEKIFYGLDDIKGIDDIIIVEGEMDKLSMEEAGFRNCVSVPDGAPPRVSSKDLPPEAKDKAFKFVWNCKKYLDKPSRIILATDGDKAGRALAEELARRLGKERCRLVRWPKKDDSSFFKDANEVLTCLGSKALTEAIETAEAYPSEI